MHAAIFNWIFYILGMNFQPNIEKVFSILDPSYPTHDIWEVDEKYHYLDTNFILSWNYLSKAHVYTTKLHDVEKVTKMYILYEITS